MEILEETNGGRIWGKGEGGCEKGNREERSIRGARVEAADSVQLLTYISRMTGILYYSNEA